MGILPIKGTIHMTIIVTIHGHSKQHAQELPRKPIVSKSSPAYQELYITRFMKHFVRQNHQLSADDKADLFPGI